ncbi:MAG: hypothetical protein AAFY41_19345, partial [Bacteroidota bacterium]
NIRRLGSLLRLNLQTKDWITVLFETGFSKKSINRGALKLAKVKLEVGNLLSIGELEEQSGLITRLVI